MLDNLYNEHHEAKIPLVNLVIVNYWKKFYYHFVTTYEIAVYENKRNVDISTFL